MSSSVLETTNSMQSVTPTAVSDSSQPDQQATRSSLIVAATGLGKTVIMGGLARTWPQGRVMLMSHRYELNQQAMASLSSICGEDIDLEQAGYFADQRAIPHRVVVASVQTLNSYRRKLGSYRYERFAPEDFGLLLIDEAHRAAAASYRKVIEHFRQNPDLCVVGVTATPDRLDGVGMGHVFETVACDLNLLWGVKNGWLVPPKQVFVQIDGLDLSKVRTKGGDLDERQLAKLVEIEENLHAMAKPIVDVCGQDKQAIVFTASVEQAHQLCQKIRDYYEREFGQCSSTVAVAIDGSLSPQDPRRKQIVSDFKAGEIQFLVNCGVACLDEETEILTSNGWVGHKTISNDHKVACFAEDGSIVFREPLAIEVRDRRADERMVALETPRRSIRVTEDHRMAYFGGATKETFRVKTAGQLVGKKCAIPISGHAEPFAFVPEQEAVAEKHLKARVRSLAYVYRQKGVSPKEARKRAESAVRSRAAMRHKLASELTLAECRLIGLWVGDGSVSRLRRGGVEYSISQSTANPSVCEWIKKVIETCGVDFVVKRNPPGTMAQLGQGHEMLKISMPRGTGFGTQKRRGVYEVEPYLSKSSFDWLWGLNREQLMAFIVGLWMADGDHRNSSEPPRIDDTSLRIASANVALNDMLQAVGSCRGLSVSIRSCKPRTSSTVPLYRLHIADRRLHIATAKHSLQFEIGHRTEKVWCVKSITGFIVTRRRGTVAITGNTEGFDAPNVRVVAIARPTKSRALYLQMLGRGTRPLPGVVDGISEHTGRVEAIKASGKPYCTVIDFVGQAGRHKLVCSTDFMAGNEPPEVVERANKLSGRADFDGDQLDALQAAKEQLEAEREAARKKVTVGVDYKLVEHGNAYDLSKIPLSSPGYMHNKKCSEKQQAFLRKLGYTRAQIEQLNPRSASKAIDHAIENPITSTGRWIKRQREAEAKS